MKFAVLGSNTSTSLSPKLHSIVYDILELNHSYSFIESTDIDEPLDFEIAEFLMQRSNIISNNILA